MQEILSIWEDREICQVRERAQALAPELEQADQEVVLGQDMVLMALQVLGQEAALGQVMVLQVLDRVMALPDQVQEQALAPVPAMVLQALDLVIIKIGCK